MIVAALIAKFTVYRWRQIYDFHIRKSTPRVILRNFDDPLSAFRETRFDECNTPTRSRPAIAGDTASYGNGGSSLSVVRQSVCLGKSVSVRLDLCGRRIINKKNRRSKKIKKTQ